MDNLKIDTLILFLSICPSLEKLFINVKILCSLFSIPAYCGLLNFFCSFIPRLIVYISLLSTKLIPVNDFQMDATNYDTPVETIPAIYRDALTNKVKNTCLNNLRVIKFENFTNEHDEFKLTERLQKVASVGAIFLTTPMENEERTSINLRFQSVIDSSSIICKGCSMNSGNAVLIVICTKLCRIEIWLLQSSMNDFCNMN